VLEQNSSEHRLFCKDDSHEPSSCCFLDNFASWCRSAGILPTKFVALGPFRCVRNPMSLGAVTMMFGLALSYRSVSILLVAAILFLVLHGIVVFVEEPGLEKRFGESYLQYKHRVNRWVPTFRYRPDTNHP
jgi:protein-S-isoprenylcysteine O-methyltransferase Ste14